MTCGGDVTVVHLPEIGIRGNTHFPMSDLNNVQIADQIIASRSGLGADQGSAAERIEEAALARVGPAGKDDAKRPIPDRALIELLAQ